MITLNQTEKKVLKYLKSFKTIRRTGTGELWAVDETERMLHLIGLSGLFQFVLERRRIRDSRTIERRINNVCKT